MLQNKDLVTKPNLPENRTQGLSKREQWISDLGWGGDDKEEAAVPPSKTTVGRNHPKGEGNESRGRSPSREKLNNITWPPVRVPNQFLRASGSKLLWRERMN